MWLNKDDAREEVQSAFYRDLNLNFTVSEYDRELKPIVYSKEQSKSVNGSELNFLSHYFVQTHQGTLFLPQNVETFLFSVERCSASSEKR